MNSSLVQKILLLQVFLAIVAAAAAVLDVAVLVPHLRAHSPAKTTQH